MSVNLPVCAITFGLVAPPQGDVVEININLGCSKEVSTFDVLLQNWDKKYSSGGAFPILIGTTGGIGICRAPNDPTTVPIISLKVESIKYESDSTANYVRVSGRCWGERLFRRLVTKTYLSKKGEYIVKDLMDTYAGLSHVRGAVELVEDTDTTFVNLEYENTPVWDILKYIAETSDKAGVIGFDFRVAPDGKFEFFPKGSKVTHEGFSGEIESSSYRKDISRVRNKIYVYGVNTKEYPSDIDQDGLTEILTGWSSSNYLSLDANHVAEDGQRPYSDSYSVMGSGGPSDVTINLKRTFAAAIKCKNVDGYKALSAWLNWEPAVDASSVIAKLYSGVSDFYWCEIKSLCGVLGAWAKIGLTTQDALWTAVGVPDWGSIIAVEFIVTYPDGLISRVRVDHLFFRDCRFSAMEENVASQVAYTDSAPREFSETDEELLTDAECDLRAKALLAYLKDSAEYLTVYSSILDYGTAPLLAADNFHATLPNENVDTDFHIESVNYRVNGDTQTLEVTVELGKVPPQLADYLYGLRTFTVNVEKLARTKFGKGVFVSSGGNNNGGLARAHHNTHEAGDDGGVQWATPEAGGLDKISGWIAPGYIGPFNDVAAIIWFRTKNKAGTSVLDHQFAPTDDEHGLLGIETKNWKEAWITTLFVKLTAYFGVDKAVRLWAETSSLLATNAAFEALSLQIGWWEVITAARVLQNVTADAGIITTGRFPFARLPQGGAGSVFEAQGWAADPAYVDPNGRYAPAAHEQSADTITWGGVTADVAVAKVEGGTRTLHFMNSKYTGYTDS